MRTALAVLFAAAAAFAGAPPNSVTLTNTSGSPYTNYVFSIPRFFAKGEIRDFPKPQAGGADLAEWQVDIKTRWADSRASCAIVGASNAIPIEITCNDHGFWDGDWVEVAGVGGNTAANGRWKITRITRHKFILTGSAGSGAFTSGGTASGPSPAGGSVQFAVISFKRTLAASSSTVVSFVNSRNACHLGVSAVCQGSALVQEGMLNFNGGDWGAAMEVAAAGSQAVLVNARSMIAAGAFRYWLRGPVVTQVIAEDRSTARAFDFGFALNAATSPSLQNITFSAATVDVAADMITAPNWNPGNGSRLQFIRTGGGFNTPGGLGPGVLYYAVQASGQTFKVSTTPGGGPINITSTGDMQANIHTDYLNAVWDNDAANRVLHPAFLLTFPSGWPGVKADYILENCWGTLQRDQRYSVSLKTGANLGTTVYTKSSYPHWALTRWRRTFWSGSAPQLPKVDLNREYLSYSRVLPLYDYNLNVGAAEVSQVASNWAAANQDIGGAANYTSYFPASGGRDELGLMEKWNNVYLYTWDPSLWNMVTGNGNASGHIPIHFRESYSSSPPRYFIDVDGDGDTYNDSGDNAAGNAAFGRVFSVDARPSLRIDYGYYGAIDAEDAAPRLTPLSTVHSWSIDLAHQAAFAFVPYLVTGDYFYLEEMQFWASFNIGWHNAYTDYHPGRRGSWGILGYDAQTRGVAWSMRTLGYATLLTPDGTIEKEYFRTKLDNKLQQEEGENGILDGDHFNPLTNAPAGTPCPTAAGTNPANGQAYSAYYVYSYSKATATPFCWGLRTVQLSANPLGFADRSTIGAFSDGRIDTSKIQYTYLSFHNMFKWVIYGWLRELGFRNDPVWRRFTRLALMFAHPGHNKYLCCNYQYPIMRKTPDNTYFRSIQEHFNSFLPAGRAKSTWNTVGSDASDQPGDPDDGYVHYYAAALGFLRDRVEPGVDGASYYDWFRNQANVPNIVDKKDFANRTISKWAMVGRRDPVRLSAVRAGSTQAVFRYVSPTSAACTVLVDDDPVFGSPAVNASDGGVLRERLFSASGLAAGTEYFYRITCSADPFQAGRVEGSFSTTSGGGVTTIPVRLGGLPAAASARIDHGPTEALGSSTASISCSAGCTLSVPATAGQVLYYQAKYLDAGGATIAAGQLEATIR